MSPVETPLATVLPAGEAPAASAPPALRRLVLCGGGTGGHLMPGIAVVEAALERFPGLEVTFFRTRREVEDRVFAGAGIRAAVRELDLPPPSRSPLGMARFIARAIPAALAVRSEIRARRPDCLVALGGYPSLPGIAAARLERIPLVLLEQNRAPGKVVRRFAGWADAVACPDAAAAGRLGGHRGTIVAVTGNPVRRAVVLAARSRRDPAGRPPAGGGETSRPRTVLVVGGSQGARGLNRAVTGALPALRPHRGRISWIHVAGGADHEEVAEAYRREGWEARVFAYTADLPALLAGSDLVLSRAGGTIVAEIGAIRVPAVLVPYPHHRDRHQVENARSLVEAGAALLEPEDALGPERFARLIEELVFDGRRLAALEAAARRAGRPDAAEAVVDLIVRVAAGGKAGGT